MPVVRRRSRDGRMRRRHWVLVAGALAACAGDGASGGAGGGDAADSALAGSNDAGAPGPDVPGDGGPAVFADGSLDGGASGDTDGATTHVDVAGDVADGLPWADAVAADVSGRTHGGDTGDATSADAAPKTWVIPPGLHGQPAPEPLPLPVVTAVVDTSNQPVDTAVLLGQWTVMWFYPAASTFG